MSKWKPKRHRVRVKRVTRIKAEVDRLIDQEWPMSLPWWIQAGRKRYGLPA